LISGVNRLRSDIDLGKLGYVRTAYDGQRGWNDSAFHPFEELFGPRLKQLKFEHPLWLLQDWREVFDSAAIVQTGEVDGEKVFVLKLSAKGIPTHTLHVSAESGLVLKEETVAIALDVYLHRLPCCRWRHAAVQDRGEDAAIRRDRHPV